MADKGFAIMFKSYVTLVKLIILGLCFPTYKMGISIS